MSTQCRRPGYVWSLGPGGPGEGMATYSNILALRIPGQRSLYSPWGRRVRCNWETTTFHYEHTETGFKSAGWGETTDLRLSIIFWNTKEAVSTHLVFSRFREGFALKFCHRKKAEGSMYHGSWDQAQNLSKGLEYLVSQSIKWTGSNWVDH